MSELLTGYVAENGAIVTPAARGAFVNVIKPRPNNLDPQKRLQYSLTLLFPADVNLAILKKAAGEAARGEWGDKLNDPAFAKRIRSPFRMQDDFADQYEGFERGNIFIRLSADEDHKPIVLDASTGAQLQMKDVYSGAWFRAIVNPFTYDRPENKGVSFGLASVQKVRDDKPFTSGGGDPSTVFKPVAGAKPPAETAAAGKTAGDLF